MQEVPSGTHHHVAWYRAFDVDAHSAQLRAKGVQAYGIGSLATEEDANRIHGNDERLSISGLRVFLEFLYSVVVDVAGAK